ncbi:hypothetical protein [Luteimonas sp. MC1572]|uniref:hypothetical protein n=1 Tax=Luteimonas sp. MC1572 TaxID=2799325 RepID=UPI0018F0BC1A|nr:hypothetical protein [Luteimonas sp. MC1572]MBJ6982011.1 hypothetical protein [Luteimonas sp. MC1572]QQO03310.1 hypothetical protein JGR64_00550 [Luteimonas sp. MC1572]
MSDETVPQPGHDSPPPGSRIAFERLRERTDELELIISGLLAFALLTVPGRIFDSWATNAIHVEGLFEYALQFGFLVSAGLSYALAFAFIIHLAIRGYWIGLIGLKSTFPAGIRWERVPFMGTVARAFHQERVGDLGSTIDRADRAASILFAMTILIALTIAWVGVLAVVLILLGGLMGSAFHGGQRAIRVILVAAYVLFLLASLAPVVLERLIARREAAGKASPGLQRTVRGLLRFLGIVIPQRLIAPVQLTLQSNLNGRGFMAVYVVVIALAMLIGSVQVVNSAMFSMINRYDVLTGEAVDHGMLSAHYESLRSEHDLLLRYPMIPADRIAEAHLRLFIPHQPKRDNPLARERCPALPEGRNSAEGPAAATLAHACIASFWRVTLDGKALPLDDFVPIERRDLGMRGLVGYVPIGALPPGRHDLYLAWNADGEKEGPLRRREYRIPFWFTPGVEQGVR